MRSHLNYRRDLRSSYLYINDTAISSVTEEKAYLSSSQNYQLPSCECSGVGEHRGLSFICFHMCLCCPQHQRRPSSSAAQRTSVLWEGTGVLLSRKRKDGTSELFQHHWRNQEGSWRDGHNGKASAGHKDIHHRACHSWNGHSSCIWIIQRRINLKQWQRDERREF